METYGKILLIAMPAFLFLVLFEKWYGWRRGKDTVRNMDMIASLSSGITNVTKDVAGLSFVILSYPFLVKASRRYKYSIFCSCLYHRFFFIGFCRVLGSSFAACY